MTGTDLALLELYATYREVMAAVPGLTPLPISRRPPFRGMVVTMTSVNRDRRLSCTVDRIVPTVKEGPWTWHDAIRFRPGCDLVHGVSGAAAIEGGEIVGLAQTVAENGSPCALDNPCEEPPVEDGAKYAYGASTSVLYACYDAATRAFDFDRIGCPLLRRAPR